MEEVALVQNLVYYIERSYRTPGYGSWGRGTKYNDGTPEVSASAIGMAKAALEAVNGFNLFGETINLEIRGQAAHKSFTGLVLSLGIFTTLLAYGTNKFFVFKDY